MLEELIAAFIQLNKQKSAVIHKINNFIYDPRVFLQRRSHRSSDSLTKFSHKLDADSFNVKAYRRRRTGKSSRIQPKEQ